MSCLGKGSDIRYREGSQTEEESKEERKRSEQPNTNLENQTTSLTKRTNYKIRRRNRKRNKRKLQRQTKIQISAPVIRQRQYDDEDKTWGDELTIDNEWMESNDSGKIRLLHLNTNGITSKNEYVEWEILLDSLEQYQADIFCLNETKLDTRQSQVQFDIRDRAKRLDKHLHINMNSSLQQPATVNSIFKPGGTMVGTRGNWSGRTIHITSDKAKDKLGRWSVTHLRGKNNTTITILSIYQVCSRGYEGGNTAYLQQQADIYKLKGRFRDPRNELCKDLRTVLQQLNEQQHKIIICADINDDVGYEYNNLWNQTMEEAGMRHVLSTLHEQRPLPRTYDRGVRCLDTIMVSDNIHNDHILRAGILPFYTVSASDHRAIYVDIDVKSLFQDITIDKTKHTHHRCFTTKM